MKIKFLFILSLCLGGCLKAAECENNGKFTYLWRIGEKNPSKVPAGFKPGSWFVPITLSNCPLPPSWASSVVKNACDEWNNSTGFNPVILGFQGQTTGPNLVRNIGTGDLAFVSLNRPTFNEVSLIGDPRDPDNRKLAVTYGWMDPKDYNCGEGDEFLNPIADEVEILFNPVWPWGSVSLPPVGISPNRVVDFKSVVLHELGHLLGLGHWNGIGFSGAAVMNSKISRGQINDIISYNDIDQLERLYTFDRFTSPNKPFIQCECFTKSAWVECKLKSGCGSDIDQSSCSRDGYCSPGSTCGHGGTTCSKKPGQPGPKCRKSKFIDENAGMSNEMTKAIIEFGEDQLSGNLFDLSDLFATNYTDIKEIGEKNADNFALQVCLIETYNHLMPLIESSLVEKNIALVKEEDVVHFCVFLDLYSDLCKDEDLKLSLKMLKRALPMFVGLDFKDALIKYDRLKYEEIMAFSENKCAVQYPEKALIFDVATFEDGNKGVIHIKANYEFSISYEVVDLFFNKVKFESQKIELLKDDEITKVTPALCTGFYRVIPTINNVRRLDLSSSFSVVSSQ